MDTGNSIYVYKKHIDARWINDDIHLTNARCIRS